MKAPKPEGWVSARARSTLLREISLGREVTLTRREQVAARGCSVETLACTLRDARARRAGRAT